MKTVSSVLPGSKNITQRALLIASLIDGVSTLANIFLDEETRAFMQALNACGVLVAIDESVPACVVKGNPDHFAEASQFFLEKNPAEEVTVSLIAAPFSEKPVIIEVQDRLTHADVNITSELIGDFGVLVKRMHHGRYVIPVPQNYSARDYTIEPDMARAAYYFAYALLTETTLHVQPISREKCKQPAIQFFDALEKMGCHLIETETEFVMQPPAVFSGVSVDVREFSEIFNVLAVLAAFATTPTTLTNIAKDKAEIDALRETLEQMKIIVESGTDWMKIFPSKLSRVVGEKYFLTSQNGSLRRNTGFF